EQPARPGRRVLLHLMGVDDYRRAIVVDGGGGFLVPARVGIGAASLDLGNDAIEVAIEAVERRRIDQAAADVIAVLLVEGRDGTAVAGGGTIRQSGGHGRLLAPGQ